jgi:hypothetical protein
VGAGATQADQADQTDQTNGTGKTGQLGQAGAAPSLEQALEATERDANAALRAAGAVTNAVKRVRTAAVQGNLRDLRPAITAAEDALAGLREALANTREGWDFDEDAYFAGGHFQRELLATARKEGVAIYEQDDRLYSYPSLVRVVPGDRAVLIDRTRERRLRPSVLVAHLRDLQKRPPRFRPEAFLEALYSAYVGVVDSQVARRGRDLLGSSPAVRLVDVYDRLTLLPGQSREYSRQEFARDVYLLDQSGVRTTRKGATVRFPASTGTRTGGATVRVISQGGQEQLYYGIAFDEPDTAS